MRQRAAIAFLFTLGLAACGGGGGGSGGGDGGGGSGDGTGSSHLSVSASAIKTLSFRWDAVAGVSHYRLFEDADGNAGPQAEQLLAQPPAGQHGFTQEDVFLPSRVNARYRLQACGVSACQDLDRTGIEDIHRGIGYFKASNPAANDEFGEGLALSADGQLLVVGAHLEDGLNEGINSVPDRGTDGTNVGAVYVFHRGAAGWVQEAYLKPEHALPGAKFGFRLALARHGDAYTLLVGSPNDSSGGSGVGADPAITPGVADSGAAHVFERDAQGAWTQTHYIKAQTTATDGASGFGMAVSLSADGQWAAVGHPYAPGGGAVSLYRREAGGWVFQRSLQGSNTEAEDGFGLDLQLDAEGRTLVVGAWGEDGSTSTAGADNGTPGAGAVYVFTRDGNNPWPDRETAYLKAHEPREQGLFGAPLALTSAGDALVVGEQTNDGSGATSGRAHVFKRLSGGSWAHETFFASPLPQATGYFGAQLALAADGSTLVIANPSESSRGSGLTDPPVVDPAYARTGSVYLYHRTATGAWTPPQPIKGTISRNDLYFGWSLALSADGGTLAAYGSDHSLASGIGGDQSNRSAYWAGAVFLY